MKYTKEDLDTYDIMWYGIDKFGRIFVAWNAGRGYIPDYILNDKESNESVCNYMLTGLTFYGKHEFLVRFKSGCSMTRDCTVLAGCGIYCFDDATENYDYDNSEYKLVARPGVELKYNEIYQVFENVNGLKFFDIDITSCKFVDFQKTSMKDIKNLEKSR